MKHLKIINAFVLIALLALLMTITGCSWFNNEYPVMRLAEKIPERSLFLQYWDIDKMLNDDDLFNAYDEWLTSHESWLEGLGINYWNVHYIAESSDSVIILQGDFRANDISSALEDRSYTEDVTSKWRHWESPDATEWVVFANDVLFVGPKSSVSDCVDVLDGDESFADDEFVIDVMDELPYGISSIIHGEKDRYILAWGETYEKKGSEELKVTTVYRFMGNGAASSDEESIKKEWEDKEGHRDVKVSVNGKFVKVTAVMDQDLLEPLP